MSTEAAQILDQTQAPAPVATPTATTSATPEEVKEQPDERMASKLEMLLKREQQALERERLAKERERDVDGRFKRVEEFESIKTNPKKALELLGLSYDELTQAMLADGSIPPEVQIRRLDEKLEQFKSEQQKAEELRIENEKKLARENEERIITNFKGEISQYIKDNVSRYELTAFEEQQDLVFDVIDEHYNRTQKVMTIQEAADKVELYLEQKETKRKELSKIKTIWGMLPPPAQKQVQAQIQTQKPKTLTNNLTASPPAPIKRVPISDEERVQRAIAFAKGLRPDLR
jgi:hypothetical protein